MLRYSEASAPDRRTRTDASEYLGMTITGDSGQNGTRSVLQFHAVGRQRLEPPRRLPRRPGHAAEDEQAGQRVVERPGIMPEDRAEHPAPPALEGPRHRLVL